MYLHVRSLLVKSVGFSVFLGLPLIFVGCKSSEPNYQQLAEQLIQCFEARDKLSEQDKQKFDDYLNTIDYQDTIPKNTNDPIELQANELMQCRNNILNPLSIEQREKIFDVFQEMNYYPDL